MSKIKPKFVYDKSGQWIIEGVSNKEAQNFLEKYAPWRMELQFLRGPRASDYETFTPFNEYPLRKLMRVIDRIDLPASPKVLDIGFNCGYNSLFMASQFGASVTGIDVDRKHKGVADDIASMIGANSEFLLESAEEFERPDTFDLIMHFGTLYHLPNPLLSMTKAAKSLRKGGWFALETIRYTGDPSLAKWIWGFNGDRTNFWALGSDVISDFFARSNLSKPTSILSANIAMYDGLNMDRTIWLAQKK